MRRIVFIVNKNSVKKQNKSVDDAIAQKFNQNDNEVKIVYTEYAGHAEVLSKEAIQNGTDVIVAVGGDGTVNEVATPIINSGVILGIIPMGSGNGLARHLGIPRNIDKAIELIKNFNTTIIDTCTVDNKPFISIAGVGFDAYVAEKFSKGTRRGFLGYFSIVANEYISYKSEKYKLSFSGGEIMEVEALFIAFANSNQFGYNTTIAPHATLNDGLMDICIIKKPEIYKLPLIANLLLLRKLEMSPLVKIIKTSELNISRTRPGIVNIDGEAIMFDKDISVKINPLSLKIIINPDVSKV